MEEEISSEEGEINPQRRRSAQRRERLIHRRGDQLRGGRDYFHGGEISSEEEEG